MRRRSFLAWLGLAMCMPPRVRAVEYPAVTPRALRFPFDHGAHPLFRTEWWYITGWLGEARGFQITFFRHRPGVAEDTPSAFAPVQLIFAHAAVSDPARGALLHDQRIARAGFGLAGAREGDTEVWIDDWRLVRGEDGYRGRIAAAEFAFDLRFLPTQPILLQGEAGVSRKGPRREEASYYYSRPHLAVQGELQLAGRRETVRGHAWLDHEWSTEYLAAEAAGWDWTGLNLDDGAALMAFRIRAKDGSVRWAGGAYRDAQGRRSVYGPGDIRFEPLRRWRSPRSDIEYPVAMRVHLGPHTFTLEPLMDDQELDARTSAGTIYWEGAMRVLQEGRCAGRGYMELTGYTEPLRM